MKSYYKFDNKFNLKKILKNQNNKKYKNKESKNLILGLNNLNIGIYLITPIILGLFIGYNLDRYLNSKPLFILIFILLGTSGTFYNLYKLIKE